MIEDYRAPTGSLRSVNLEAFGNGVVLALEALGTTTSFDFASELIGALDPLARDLRVDEADGVAPGLPDELRRDALVAAARVDHVCAGHEADSEPAVLAARDGSVHLEAAIDDMGLFPMLWGTVDSCRLKLGGARIRLDGRLTLVVDAGRSRVRTRDLTRAPIIALFRGAADIDDGSRRVEDVRVDLRRARSSVLLFEGLQLRLESEIIESTLRLDGEVYVLAFARTTLSPSLPELVTFGVRASDGLWSCNLVPEFNRGSCRDLRTDEEVTW